MAKTKQPELSVREQVEQLLNAATEILTEEYSKDAKNPTSSILISLELIKLQLKNI